MQIGRTENANAKEAKKCKKNAKKCKKNAKKKYATYKGKSG